MRVPRDPALPRLGVLLDPDAMAVRLERSLGRPARLHAARIARISYKPGERVTVHYHAGQLLRARASLVLLDLEAMCLGSPALDLAEYAAAAGEGPVLEAIVDGYGACPEGLACDLAVSTLVRASHPFHRARPAWRDRVEALVRVAERRAPT